MKFGLLGYPLTHSHSKEYFTEKFRLQQYHGFTYDNFPLSSLPEALPLLHDDFMGFNVTIPYKEQIITYLNDIDETAFKIGAVNTLVKTDTYSWKGFNTDVTGFGESIDNWFGQEPRPKKALILGTGGSSKAVRFVLANKGIQTALVSRRPGVDFTYEQLDESLLTDHQLIINTTPLGMFPDISQSPRIPYEFLTEHHWLYDLIYNPVNTVFLTRGEQAGAKIKNGLEMLRLQADHAWAIWKFYGKF